jgi:hypothetical protein
MAICTIYGFLTTASTKIFAFSEKIFPRRGLTQGQSHPANPPKCSRNSKIRATIPTPKRPGRKTSFIPVLIWTYGDLAPCFHTELPERLCNIAVDREAHIGMKESGITKQQIAVGSGP